MRMEGGLMDLNFLCEALENYLRIEHNAREQIKHYEKERQWALIGIKETRALIKEEESRSQSH